jgi:hypothetical protein
MDVFGIFIAVSFIGLILTLAVMNIVKKITKAQEYKPKSKVLTNTYDAWKNHDSQELFDTGKMPPVIGVKCENISVDDSWYRREINEAQEKYLETVPSHKTRVALRKKRQREK